MAHKKSAGATKNGRDSNPKYLGIKVADGEEAQAGSILVRQRGSDVLPGHNVGIGRDHTLFALRGGLVSFGYKRKTHFNNKVLKKKILHVLPAETRGAISEALSQA